MLKFPQEMECIWSKPISVPSFLYISTKYGILFLEGVLLIVVLRIMTRFCLIPYMIALVFFLFFMIGLQGLLIARVYAVGTRSRLLIGCLIVGCSVPMITSIIDYSTVAGSLGSRALSVITDVSFIFTDGIAFWISTGDIWATWKLKREAGLLNSNDITSVLLRQSVMRCIAVLLLAVAGLVSNQIFEPMVTHSIELWLLSLAAIIVSDFFLDLRQCNSAAIGTSAIATLPTIQFQNISQRVHESIIAELRTPMFLEEEFADKDEI